MHDPAGTLGGLETFGKISWLVATLRNKRSPMRNVFLMAAILSLGLQNCSKLQREEAPKSSPVVTLTPQARNARIERLINQMSVKEKAGQLSLASGGMATTGPAPGPYLDQLRAGHLGAIFNIYDPQQARQIQELALASPNAIPVLMGYDVIHGHRTIFPVPLGESSSWDLGLMEQSAHIAAQEAAADGLHWIFAPMVDVARDARWGRITEGAGEDAWLGSQVAVARVKGAQRVDENDLPVYATVKHFAAYGAPTGLGDYKAVNLSMEELFEDYLPPYEAAVKAGVGSLMTSFNSVNRVPATGNFWLLQNILRNEWGFKGLVVSDYESIMELTRHKVVKSDKEAALRAFKAGVDMAMVDNFYYRYIPELVQEGQDLIARKHGEALSPQERARIITMEELDQRVRRVLEIKDRLGLFDDPFRYCDPARAQRVHRSTENMTAAREVAKKSIVLLKNERKILPLPHAAPANPKVGDIAKVAVIGPFIDNQMDVLGSWWGVNNPRLPAVTLRQGITNFLTQHKDRTLNVRYAQGSNLVDKGTHRKKMIKVRNLPNGQSELYGDPSDLFQRLNKGDSPLAWDARPAEVMLQEAVTLAKDSDVVVLALGEPEEMSGEAAVRSELGLPTAQKKLFDTIAALGKPIVLVLFNGRPLTLDKQEGENVSVAEQSTAILETWFLGTQSGNAIADVLFGLYNPSGKLTVSFPRNVGQIPVHYNQLRHGRPSPLAGAFDDYKDHPLDVEDSPLYPFGFGLSYTQYEYGEVHLSQNDLRDNEKIIAKVEVANVGKVAGEEIVQLYVRDQIASLAPKVKQLAGFKKIAIAPGERKTVEFEISQAQLKLVPKIVEREATENIAQGNLRYQQKRKYRTVEMNAEPGDFEILIGPSSDDAVLKRAAITLIGTEEPQPHQ